MSEEVIDFFLEEMRQPTIDYVVKKESGSIFLNLCNQLRRRREEKENWMMKLSSFFGKLWDGKDNEGCEKVKQEMMIYRKMRDKIE